MAYGAASDSESSELRADSAPARLRYFPRDAAAEAVEQRRVRARGVA